MRTAIAGTLVLSTAMLFPGAVVQTGAVTGTASAVTRTSSAVTGTSSTERVPVVRHVTIPAGTVLRLRVNRGFGSDISRVEDRVPATLSRAIVIGGQTVLPAGSTATGYVSEATRPGKVKGRGRVAVRFNRIAPPSEGDTYRMDTQSWVAVAPASKKKDALTIALPAAGGAAIGALVDGKKGAGIGSLIGGGAGTAAVLSTRGKEVRVGNGAILSVRLAAPLTVAVRQ
jgi:hypothetical protein